MKYLHIIPLDSLLILPLAKMIQRYGDADEHEFMVTVTYQSILRNDPKMLGIKGLKCIPSFKRHKKLRKMLFIFRQAKKADHVIWHSFRTNSGYNPVLLFLNRKLLMKSTWIAADGELGNYTNVPNRILNRFIPRITRYVQKRLAYIGVCFPSDQEVFANQGIDRARIAVLPYPIPAKREALLDFAIRQDKLACGAGCLKLQLGMTSQRGNQHRALMEKMSGLAGVEQAFAFIPFKYFLKEARCVSGTKKYQNSIRRKGKQLPCRSVFMDRPVSAQSFLKYVSQLDAVFLMNQAACALEFLFYLLAQEKKVFLPADSPLFIYLNCLGAGIQPLERIDEGLSLQEVLDCPNACLPAALKDYYHTERLAGVWEEWFQSLSAARQAVEV